MSVFTQYREVVTEAAAFRDLDMDIKVTMDKEGKLKFDISLWNLAKSTWNGIEKDDLVQVKAGWEEGPVEVLVYGKINSTDASPDGNDMQFQMKGVGQTQSAANARISRSWRNADAGDIAADIGQDIGLTPRTIRVGEVISGNWSVTRDRQAKKWLDDLVEIAGEKTGVEWQWHGEQGELIFEPKDSTQREAPVLSWDTNLIALNKMEDSEDDTEKIEFEAMMVPGIRKGAAVDVQAPQFSDVWKVERYEHNSATSGDHYTQGVLLPTDIEYAVESQRAVNAASKRLDRLGVE